MSVSDQQIIDVAEQYAKRYRVVRDREDVRQEICVALLRARKRYDPEKASWKTYADRIAQGVLLDSYRSQPSWDRGSGEIVRFIEYVEEGVQEDDLIEQADLRLFLDKLQPRSRLIILCLLNGRSVKDIARILEVSDERVYRLISRLRVENTKLWDSVLKA